MVINDIDTFPVRGPGMYVDHLARRGLWFKLKTSSVLAAREHPGFDPRSLGVPTDNARIAICMGF